MRVTEDRYDRDRLRFDLALRMMRHGARNHTIRSWTGLTEDRLRKLYRAYLRHLPSGTVHRHRGKIPQFATYFLHSPALAFEATTLACLFRILGLLPRDGAADQFDSTAFPLEQAEAFCQAYEAYLALQPRTRVTFEFAWFLFTSLVNKDGVKLSVCGRCSRLYLTDVSRIELAHCGCTASRPGLPRRRRRSVKPKLQTEVAPSAESAAVTTYRVPETTRTDHRQQ
jgi:hypothetical protein